MNPSDHRRKWVLAALEQFEGRLVRYARRLLGNEDEARDVVQFTFLRLCDESPEAIEGRLAQWLFTVCRNRAMDVLCASGRQKSNDNVGAGRGANHGSPGFPSGHPQPPSRERDPADSAEQSDLHALLRLLIDHLPANQREAIDLWAEGFRYTEISKILDCEEGHVRVLVHRGLKTVREDRRVKCLINDTSAAEAATGSSRGRKPTGSAAMNDAAINNV